MITFNFNGLDFAGDISVNQIIGRGITPSEVSTVEVPGMVGVRAGRKKRQPRILTIEFTVRGTSLTDLRDKINTLSERLDLDEVAPLVFSDEPDKTYFAILAGATDDEELREFEKGSLTFLCPDPYKYGPEQIATLNTESGSVVNVAGTAPTKPIFELIASAPETYAMVSKGADEYNMIGAPTDVDDTVYSPRTLEYFHNMQNMTNWATANPGETDYTIAGTMVSEYDFTTEQSHFEASDYGVASAVWHGPARKYSFATPLQDFKLQTRVKLSSAGSADTLGNVEVYLLDVNGKIVARIGMQDGSYTTQNVMARAYLGEVGTTQKKIVASQGSRRGTFNNFDGIIQLSRENGVWEAYFAKTDGSRHHTRLREPYYDTNEEFQNPIAQVVVATHKFSAYPAASTAIRSMTVEHINEEPGTPYIVYEGDEVIFDHNDKGEYFVNGADAKRLKNFGANPFTLDPGYNTIVLSPGLTYSGTVRWRDAYK